MPLPPSIKKHIYPTNQQYDQQCNWDYYDSDCDSNTTPISMRDLEDFSPYHIPSSPSVSSCEEDYNDADNING